jgi:predicted TIM-barrel fold metal-dependent hydrolase
MKQRAYGVFDADNHLYEPPEVITEYLPKQHARDLQFVQVHGRPRIAAKGRIIEFITNPTFERVAAPGVHVAYYAGDNPDGKTLREMTGEPIECLPAFREPGPRLELLDELGVHRALIFPTLATLLEYSLDGDPDLTHIVIHALNQWMHDTWTFDYQDRLFATPVITLAIVEEAIKELEWALERNAKAVFIRPAPATGLRGPRSIGLPEFDPFWARVQEAGLPVCLHGAFPPLVSYYQTWEPGRTDSAHAPTPLRSMLIAHREIEDTLAALVCQGTLSRFPRLAIMSVENGASWVADHLRRLDHVYRQLPQDFVEHPVTVFKRNVYINPFWEDDVGELVDLIGAAHVVFGSDYPHPEGLAEPTSYFDDLDKANISEPDQRLIMSDNGNQLLGLAI